MFSSSKKIIQQNSTIILASQSPARQAILSKLALDFKVVKPSFDESAAKPKIKDLSIKDQALYLAKHKALSVSIDHPQSLTIGSDQICEFAGLTIDKSNNHQEAVLQLKAMQGKTHYQNNAVCLYLGNKLLFKNYSQAKLTMRNLTDCEIENYVKSDQSWGCAGSYKFESLGKHLFSQVIGCDDLITGMDVLPLLHFLYQQNLISL